MNLCCICFNNNLKNDAQSDILQSQGTLKTIVIKPSGFA